MYPSYLLRNSLAVVVGPLLILLVATLPSTAVAQQTITHQIVLSAGVSWCDDGMILTLFNNINTFRTQNGLPTLAMDQLGMEDAEMRAVQFSAYMATATPGPGFNPHQGYDTTAAALGYNLVSENLAYVTTDPNYIVYQGWQDSLHLAALLASDANVMGVSCVYSNGWPYWTYEPGIGTSAPAPGPGPGPTPIPVPGGTPVLDSEQLAFLALINSYRAQNGAGPVQVSVTLQNASQWMSTDLSTNNGFSHTDSRGRSTGARLAAFGYTYSPWGEDIAGGYADAQDVLNAWVTGCDPDASGTCTYAHRAILLSRAFVAIGIGRFYNANSAYGWYWTADFGAFLDQPLISNSAPVISSFVATPSSVSARQSAMLSWNVSGATSISIDNGVGNVSGLTSIAVAPGNSTTYTLTAANATGSSTASVTITVQSGTPQPPSAPQLTSATAKSSTEVDLSWTASTSSAGVAGYQIIRNGSPIATVVGTSLAYADVGVSASSIYAYAVRAFDAAGNISALSNSVQVTTPAPATSSDCPAPVTGAFTGCYYDNIGLAGSPFLVRTDSQINFDWLSGSPDPSIPRDNFSVSWQGWFTFNQGPYTFTAFTSDGMRVYIDGNIVLDAWRDQAGTIYTLGQTLSQGNHLLVVEYYDHSGTSTAHFSWQAGSTTSRR